MQETALLFVIAVVLGSPTGRISASYCYPDYCLVQNLTHLVPAPDFQCVLTSVQRGEGCAKIKFVNAGRSSKQNDIAVFTLRAYVANLNDGKATMFNLSISDINFHRLTVRYQNIIDDEENACRHVELYGNATHPAPKELYVSCPFSGCTYEGFPYRLEYLAIGKNYAYSRRFVFHVPQHELIEDGVQIERLAPFVYIDVSDSSNPALYVQPLPPKYNVTEYKAWLINNNTQSTFISLVLSSEGRGHVRHNFSAPDGIYYVKVAALHPGCGECGCSNSTSPPIYIKHASHRLLIMIISLMWIPPVILYALYHVFKMYRKRVLKRMTIRPNCLLVYSPTHPSHVNVMAEFAKYLRYCHINAMIDIFDIAETSSKDPGLWCNNAFQTADVVLVVTSPPASLKSDATIIYRNVDNHLLRLLKENYPRRNKRYYAIQLPYCKSDRVPEEARLFRKFRIPEDLAKLVNAIHGIAYLRFFVPSDQELLESIKFATAKISEDEAVRTTKNTEETDDLLPPVIAQETENYDVNRPIRINRPDLPDNDAIPQTFTTRIDELNLLGEIEKDKSFAVRSARDGCDFRIDKLKL